jgi:TonB family protein
MFEFAISRNQRLKPTKRMIASRILSCVAHFLLILIVVENPELLRGGINTNFRRLYFPWQIFQTQKDDNKIEKNRIVTFTAPMTAPSAEMVKKIWNDWNKNKKGEGSAPVHIPWKKPPEVASNNIKPPMPKPQESRLPEITSLGTNVASTNPTPVQGMQDSPIKPPGSQIATQSDTGKKGPPSLPSPAPSNPKPEIADNSGSAAIVSPSKSAATPAAKNTSKIGSVEILPDEKQAIKAKGTVFFDDQGYPMGDYYQKIIDAIKANWFIPDDIKDSKGRTTVIFYVDKDGHFSGTRIVMSSGIRTLDITALRAIVQSDPAPPLPKGFTGDHIGAKFVFSYNEPKF